MMRIRHSLLTMGALMTLTAATESLAAPELKTNKDKWSYALGHQIGSDLSRSGVELNYQAFLAAMQEAMAGKPASMKPEDMEKAMKELRTAAMAKTETKNKEMSAKNQKDGKAFLEKNGKEKDVKSTPSGLQYKVIKEGTGPRPKATDTVTVHYRGTLLSGKEFDSSYKRNQPATFPLNGVIKGWTEGLQLMTKGSKYMLYIPSDLGYGKQGTPGGDIGPDAVLTFEVELIDIKEADKPAASPSPAK